jgi:hypothetical protein
MAKNLDELSDETELTLEEASELVDRHYMTIYRWVRTSRLAAVKRDDRWYLTAQDLRTALSAAGRPYAAAKKIALQDAVQALWCLQRHSPPGEGTARLLRRTRLGPS